MHYNNNQERVKRETFGLTFGLSHIIRYTQLHKLPQKTNALATRKTPHNNTTQICGSAVATQEVNKY
jgi:hypothetical protein